MNTPARTPHAAMKRCYLAGPMRGIPEFNFPAFYAAAAVLRERGYEVWSPAENDVHEDGFDPTKDVAQPMRHYMKRDLPAVLNADFVAVLRGWENSQGATLEVTVARACGLPVLWADSLAPVSEIEPPVIGGGQIPTAAAPGSMSFFLGADEVESLIQFCSMDDAKEKPSPLRLDVGNGHSGLGLYASLAEYPDEGTIFLGQPNAAPQASPSVAPAESGSAPAAGPADAAPERKTALNPQAAWPFPVKP